MADKNLPLLMLHGVYQNDYKGVDEDSFYAGGFSIPLETGIAGEVYNFLPVNGRCYGHAEMGDNTIHIERLGASPDDDQIEGVLVVWTAPIPSKRGRTVVGWYNNATVHRNRIWPTGRLRDIRSLENKHSGETEYCSYCVGANEKDCVLLPPEKRILTIPTRSGMPRTSSSFFPEDTGHPFALEVAKRIRHFVATGEAVSFDVPFDQFPGSGKDKGRKKRGAYQPDPVRRNAIEEAAVEHVWNHFDDLGYQEIESVEKDNCGYDLLIKGGDHTLCVEVKGRSGVDVEADFTFNEYDKINQEERGKFDDGSYRICIVTDALNEHKSRKLHHFWCVRPNSAEKKQGKKPVWRRVDGNDILDVEPRVAAKVKLQKKSRHNTQMTKS